MTIDGSSPFVIDMCRELDKAERKHARYASFHEAYAVILEELDEFWDECRKQTGDRDPAACRKELIQIAVTAWRAAISLGLEK